MEHTTYKITDIVLNIYNTPRQDLLFCDLLFNINEDDFVVDESYGADIVLNNSILIQAYGNKDEADFYGVTHPDEATWRNNKQEQLTAFNLEYEDEVNFEQVLESLGYENNIFWLEDHATEVNTFGEKLWKNI
jgi:hypothetical protein